ncbi:UDP-N-acetylglucosamine 1-carboxyvinyltransferase [Acidisoma cellulosilytica]|uniref:UDP-N-acetylglucosamine 1-carboxyvinyltransferase n=1 Tax=Acidisoma cellulosilyticum TaxID=2802395 RepID=A0A963Z2H3_9PROT|nr:UDP-N-acetylglucosamine 1-carboxyvinyltransferase [Acidisoma cellulosilyticum]MCB8881647.1 UDP-N-acetylglucosamine 1-carboxyvinyltransferase [Acidisoma cellulosilyticum]
MPLLDQTLLRASPWWQPRPETSLIIEGGQKLVGTYPISGAKNAVLPLMVSALLTPHLVTLNNIPASLDVAVLANLLEGLGVKLSWSQTAAGLSATFAADQIHPARIDAGLVCRMRASVLILGALLGRAGEACLPMPGGDAIGLRGIDFHIAGLTAMGAEITLESGQIRARAPQGLHGADILMPLPSVGATENLMLAAVLAKGQTTIRNAALEPEIVDLALCLQAMGAQIDGAGTDVIRIAGGAPLTGAVHTVMPDRIETGTLACAAAMTNGELHLTHARLDLLGAAGPAFEAAGVVLEEVAGGLIARRNPAGLKGIALQTRPYPGFATDLQAPAMALLAMAEGASDITETIFEQRFRHVDELRKMGARIQVQGRVAFIRGAERLTGARVTGHDVRAAAAVVLAGLVAEGETVLDGLDHLDRGYDGMVEKLIACGARIRRSA